MRKAVLMMLVALGAMWGVAGTADAFCHKVRTTCIGYYPGLYSYAACGCGYAPYVYPCTYRYPKFCGHRKACWRGFLCCASRYPYGCGYGCGYGGCGTGCCGSYCYNGIGSGPSGCWGGSCGTGCGLACGGDGCTGCTTAVSEGGTSYETDSKTIYDGPAPAPEPPTAPSASDADPMAGTRQTGFQLASSTTRSGTSAYSRGLRFYWDGNMAQALAAFDAAAAAEPQNALYQYYRALTFYSMQGPQAAGDWLAQAVELEGRNPVKNWGWQMERVQGQARLWVEAARRDAGLAR